MGLCWGFLYGLIKVKCLFMAQGNLYVYVSVWDQTSENIQVHFRALCIVVLLFLVCLCLWWDLWGNGVSDLCYSGFYTLRVWLLMIFASGMNISSFSLIYLPCHLQTRLTICEGHDGTETSNGDVLIFPDMIRYRSGSQYFLQFPLFFNRLGLFIDSSVFNNKKKCRRLTHFDVETFVEEVLVKDGEWLPGNPELLKGSYVFVCSHGSRDRRCGVCGPPLVSKFREELEFYGLQGKVSVSPCSHIGGHKYAGNVIIYQSKVHRKVTGHW